MPPKKPKSRALKEELESDSDFAPDEEDLELEAEDMEFEDEDMESSDVHSEPSSVGHQAQPQRGTRSTTKPTRSKGDDDGHGDHRDAIEDETTDTPPAPYITRRMMGWKGDRARPQEPHQRHADESVLQVDANMDSANAAHVIVDDINELDMSDVFAADGRTPQMREEISTSTDSDEITLLS